MPSSLIQQNHGETINGHGYTIWDMKTCKFDHVEIPNEYAHHTIDIEDGKLKTDISNLPSKPRLRIRCKKSIATEVKSIVTEIRKKCNPSEIGFIRLDEESVIDENIIPDVDIDNVFDVDYQNKLIHQYILDVYPDIDKKSMQDIMDLNKKMNEELAQSKPSTNGLKWVPKKFEWSNVFSYGEGNVIDFTKLKDVVGIFGPNYAGKSSIFSALSWCLFDKSDKAFKANQIMNMEKMNMMAKFTFEINSVEYVIERTGTRDKKGNVPCQVTFKKIEDGKEVLLNGESRDKTNEIIRNYLGNFDDFTLTTLAIAKSKNIVEMGQTERKDLLTRFIGIDIFENLHSLAGDKIKDTAAKIKAFQKDLFEKNLAQLENEQELRHQKSDDLKDRISTISESIDLLQTKILDKTKELTPLKDVPSNITELTKKRSSLETDIEDSKKKTDLVNEKIKSIEEEISKLNEELKSSRFDNISTRYQQNRTNKEHLAKIDGLLTSKKVVVQNKLEKLKHLDEHKYDPNCKFCCDNVFVKDAIATRDSLEIDKQNYIELAKNKKEIESKIDNSIEDVYKIFKELNDRLTNLLRDQTRATNILVSFNISDKVIELNKTNDLIQLYYNSEQIIKQNGLIESEIRELNIKLKNQEYDLKSIQKEHVQNVSRLESIKDQITDITDKIEKAQQYENEHAAYQAYQVAVGKDGVPYKMVASVLPKIEREVNNILSQICEFSLKIESEGSSINIYISHSDRCWPIELCSGMEKFVSSLALRVALINVSSLPHPPILAIDEGFGTLTSENVALMPILFSFLKNQFDTIFIISHLDQMRDYVDSVVEIKKNGNFSSVEYK